MMFENILLKELLKIINKNSSKKEMLVDVFYYFCAEESLSRLHLIKKIKEYLTTDLPSFISILACLIT